ncbi:hypothetical protein MBLNU459_g8285t2 [Dothideomycetes sp. NU459]
MYQCDIPPPECAANIGVKKGDRIAVSLGNNLEHAIATYGVFKLGAILVPLNPAFTPQQVTAALTHLQASHLLIGTETNLPFKTPRSNIPLLNALVPDLSKQRLESEIVPSLRQIILVDNSHGRISTTELKGLSKYTEVLEDGGQGRPLPDQGLRNDEVVNIQFTSGKYKRTDEYVNSSCFGCILGYMATATHGSAIVFPAEAFDPAATLRAVQENGCTALYGVPTMFIAELDLLASGKIPSTGLQHLRTGIAAGSSVPAELMRKLHKTLGLTELTICYGMTETSPVSAMTTTDDPLHKRIDTVGRLLPHVEAKIVDPADRARVLAVGDRGELVVSGYLLMREYYADPARTAEVLVEDPAHPGKWWMHTGDEAAMDEDGYVRITGRIKDLIIRGGENIHPLEVENCLFAHPGVREVSVVGLPDERYGEVVAAFVVKNGEEGCESTLTAQGVRDWVRGRLSGHLVPKYVFWVDTYPKTASGKIQKFKLREMGLQMLKEGQGL